jgi:hypothetical protein
LHKGDGGNGFFIQITSLLKNPLAIPENAGSDTSMITFATLKHAQALGDASALRKFGRQILSFEIQPEDLSTFNSLI